MNIEELEKNSGLLLEMLSSKEDEDCVSIEDYVFSTLKAEKKSIEDPEIYFKNYVYLMCHICKDIKEIKDRLAGYESRYIVLEKEKSNNAEFERRKIKYFCDLNKKALKEIDDFIASGIPPFLLKQYNDNLKIECEKNGASDFFFRFRYKYAWYKDYYSKDYPFDIYVKVSQYVREKYEFLHTLEEEQKLLSLYSDSPELFWNQMDQYIENDYVMQNVLDRVSNDYNLHKRQEIFETLNDLFSKGRYQSFIALGLIQIEGLFDDYCMIRFGESENQGTLVEKVQRTLETNEYNLFRMYPYFAFDIPFERNEVAHKGMLRTEDAKRKAYNLVLDLNTLSQMVKSESFDKFVYFIMTHKKLLEWEPNNDSNSDELYDKLLFELFKFDKIANSHFWKVIRNPEIYDDEIEFYRKEELPEGMIDLPGIINAISQLIRSEDFWKAMHRLVKEHITSTSKWEDVEKFAIKMKNEYIAILGEEAKKECIEMTKIIREKSSY